jgi:hypothetical protein
MRASLMIAVAVISMSMCRRAAAQDPADLPPSAGLSGAASAGLSQSRPYWSGSGPTRGFMSAVFDTGALYMRPTLAAGYGKPHHKWAGVEGGSGISLGGVRYYAGIRGVWPGIQVRVGMRYEAPIQQFFLPPQEEYFREDIETEDAPASKYLAAEAEITGAWPMPGGSMFGVLSGYYIGGVPDPLYVFEESLKTVVAPPWMWRARLGYLLHIGWQGSMKLGIAFEALHIPLRDNTVTLRTGPLLSVALTHHLEAVAALMLVAASPDSLGVVGADLGQLGIRYRWATGDRWSEFP